MTSVQPCPAEIRRAAGFLFSPGAAVELRSFKTARNTVSGYYDNIDRLVDDAVDMNRQCGNVYWTLNAVDPALLARRKNHAEEYVRDGTKDTHILRRRWLPIDLDPVRLSGISSTQEELDDALELARVIWQYLVQDLGWAQPIVASSGNGAHLLVRVELPNDDVALGTVRGCLAALHDMFSSDTVTVDTGNFNAARIWKVYGTVACKGDDVEDRPHRLAEVLSVPEDIEIVDADRLQSLAELAPQKVVKGATAGRLPDGAFDVGKWLAHYKAPVLCCDENYSGRFGKGRKWLLEKCVWNPEHSDKSAWVIQYNDGPICAGCSHNSCGGKNWHDLRRAVEPQPTPAVTTLDSPPKSSADKSEPAENQQSRATELIALGANADLWNAEDGTAYATLEIDDHHEHWPVRSRTFKTWLSRCYYLNEHCAASSQATSDAIATLEGIAQFDGPRHRVHVRVAEVDATVYLDLGTPDWRSVQISADSWEMVDEVPVKFRRSGSMHPLPDPVSGGSVDLLRGLINISDQDWPLLACFMVAVLRGVGPYPILLLQAEQGSGKTTVGEIIKRLLDPSAAPLRSEPRNQHDLMIAANNNHLLAFDNLSHIKAWTSDALCRLSTGGGFSVRTLYETDGETIFSAERPMMITAIEEVASRGDLLDRCLIVRLPVIGKARRQRRSEIMAR